MRFMGRLLAGALAVSLLAIPGWAQGKGRDPLTDAEVDQMREAADFPNKRLELLVKFARERVFEIEARRANPKPDGPRHSARLHFHSRRN